MNDYEFSGDGDRVMDWEMGLPSDEDLASLSHSLIPQNLALAFSITPERTRTIHDVNRATETTLSSLRNGSSGSGTITEEEEEEQDRVGSSSPGSDSKKQKTTDDCEAMEEGDSGKTTSKRPRLVWTPQLHKRFVEVVAHLGIKNAVPKTIMQLMNVEGLTRENVASHLQKYRLYLKRMQGLSNEGPSASDKIFSSTPVPPQSFQDVVPMMQMQMPVYAHHMGYHHHQQNHGHGHGHHHGNDANVYTMQRSMASYPSVGGGSVNEN